MLYAYDLDGTLAHTRAAVLAAYREVGVEPPEDFFGKTWKEWLKDPAKHRAKNLAYKRLAPELVKPTKILDLYHTTGGIIITGASMDAAYTVIGAIGLRQRSGMYFELNMEQKARVLNSFNSGGIVFEDSIQIANYLAKETKWTVCHVLS